MLVTLNKENREINAEKARSGGGLTVTDRNSVPLLREFCFRVCSGGPDDEPALRTHGYNLRVAVQHVLAVFREVEQSRV